MNILDVIIPISVAAYVVVSIACRLPSKTPLAVAFFLLAVTGMAFFLDQQNVADHLAFAVFCLLVAAGILLLVDHVRERHEMG